MAKIAKFLLPPERGRGRVCYWLLFAVICGLALYLWNAQSPWDSRLQRDIERREASGRQWRTQHYVAIYGWVAAAINLVLALALFVTMRFWSRPLEGGEAEMPSAARAPRWFFVGLGIALLFGGFHRVQSLNHSLWSDEEYTVRTHIWGQMVEAEDGSLERRAVPWRDTFFRNKGNNHLGYTIPTRVIHDTWATFFSTEERPFSEAVLRLLPLLASFGSILLVGVLVARYTNPLVGLGAALLLALNPWHARISVDARGYSQMIFFLLLAFVFMLRALQSGSWRDWLGVAAAQLAAMLCALIAVDILLVANAAALVLILFTGERSRRDRMTVASRMLVANLLAAMVFFQFIAPSIEQTRIYLKTGSLVGQMSLGWWRELWIVLTSGLLSSNPEPASHIGSSFAAEAEAHPGMRLLFFFVLPGLVLLGVAGAIVRRSWLLLPGLAAIAGAVLAFVRHQLSGNLMHTWYVVYVLIGFVIFAALGIDLARQ